MGKSKKLFVIRLSAMGDVAMVSPVVSMLCREYPQLQIYVLTRPFFQPFFKKCKNLHFIDIDINNRHKGFFGILKLYRDIRREHGRFDYVADLHYAIRSRILSSLMKYFSFAKIVQIYKSRKEKQKLIEDKSHLGVPRVYTQYIDVFEKLGYPIEIPADFKFEKRPVPALFAENTKMKVGIAPFAQYRGKSYPKESMEKVVQILSARDDISLYIFGGGKSEQEFAMSLENKYPNVKNAIGVLSLDDELSLISNLKCMVTMDSSAMHMASLFGVNAITVWGATNVKCGFLGINQNPENALSSPLPCTPCSIYGQSECQFGDYRCFSDITPEMIVEKVYKYIK